MRTQAHVNILKKAHSFNAHKEEHNTIQYKYTHTLMPQLIGWIHVISLSLSASVCKGSVLLSKTVIRHKSWQPATDEISPLLSLPVHGQWSLPDFNQWSWCTWVFLVAWLTNYYPFTNSTNRHFELHCCLQPDYVLFLCVASKWSVTTLVILWLSVMNHHQVKTLSSLVLGFTTKYLSNSDIPIRLSCGLCLVLISKLVFC